MHSVWYDGRNARPRTRFSRRTGAEGDEGLRDEVAAEGRAGDLLLRGKIGLQTAAVSGGEVHPEERELKGVTPVQNVREADLDLVLQGHATHTFAVIVPGDGHNLGEYPFEERPPPRGRVVHCRERLVRFAPPPPPPPLFWLFSDEASTIRTSFNESDDVSLLPLVVDDDSSFFFLIFFFFAPLPLPLPRLSRVSTASSAWDMRLYTLWSSSSSS
mmetsp:Transcript_30092/g.89461  ORF Transcript_30092/g.89461 Transcript_30092/m.89461 type:complete len:215 (-) Transcript_30092:419-1063(-)